MEQSNHHAAILWDMDGVLVDTWELHAQTWVQAFEEFNENFKYFFSNNI